MRRKEGVEGGNTDEIYCTKRQRQKEIKGRQ
jgi:hypothetical protein